MKRRWNLKMIAIAAFGAIAAVAAALGCPVFRNPASYMTAGGAIGYLKHVIDVHRRN